LGVVGCFPRICVHDNRLQPICRPESLDRMNMILPASGNLERITGFPRLLAMKRQEADRHCA